MSKFALIFVFLISFDASAKGLQCGVLFGGSQPNVTIIADALSKLSKEEGQFFYETDWGPASDLVTPDDTFGFEKYVKDSATKPQPFYNKINERAGGIATFHNNVYAEGYYRAQAEPIAKLMKTQPYLIWDGSTGKYNIQRGNPSAHLFAPYVKNNEVTLYRGLSQAEVDLLLKLKNGDQTALKDLFSNRDAMFFTPDGTKMEMWAHEGVFIEIKLKQQDFNQVYAGIEYDYVESAIPATVISRVISSMVVHTQKTK